ncbi:unnamed protein product [Ceutorhynchus assimilis]|uniref:Tetratricopeptide repeat protein n=1 Tax=Ceutorhynchus assimilis TaxID=467358 RepID=A0A9N9QJL9_9CUCU|nr:unnamed protein product [Ceutorhynchus assimilis]
MLTNGKDHLHSASKLEKPLKNDHPEPDPMEKLNWLIHLQHIRGEIGVCKQLIDSEISRSQGKNEYVYFKQGIILKEEGNVQEALEIFQKCLKLNQKSALILKEVAKCLYEMKRFRLSLNAYLEAEQLSKNTDWQLHYFIAQTYLKLGNVEKAKEYANKSVKLGKLEESYALLMKILIGERDFRSAIAVEFNFNSDINSLFTFDDLQDHQRVLAQSVIDSFREISSDTSIGRTNKISMHIDTGDAKPFKRKQYPMSPYMLKILNQELDEMIKLVVVEPSQSPYSSPVFLVKKSNDEMRFCSDGRFLNEQTKHDSYPLPNIERILSMLRGANYISSESSVDLRKAFWQIPLDQDSQEMLCTKILHNISSKNFNRLDFMEDIEISKELRNNELCLNTQVNLNRSYIPLHRRL